MCCVAIGKFLCLLGLVALTCNASISGRDWKDLNSRPAWATQWKTIHTLSYIWERIFKPSTVAHACNSNTQEAEARRLFRVLARAALCSRSAQVWEWEPEENVFMKFVKFDLELHGYLSRGTGFIRHKITELILLHRGFSSRTAAIFLSGQVMMIYMWRISLTKTVRPNPPAY